MKIMRFRFIIFLLMGLFHSMACMAESWEDVVNSENYYYGMGVGDTEDEARQQAFTEMSQMICSYVQSGFKSLSTDIQSNYEKEHESRVEQCMETYSIASFKGVHQLPVSKEKGKYVVRLYIKRSELNEIYDQRKDRIITNYNDAEGYLNRAKPKIDLALEHYYFAYALLRSLQEPSEVKVGDKTLIDVITGKIREVMSDVEFKFHERNGNNIDFVVLHGDKTVSTLVFNYNDGRSDCESKVENGKARINLIDNYDTESYRLEIQYEFKNNALDPELKAVLDLFPKMPFKEAVKIVEEKKVKKSQYEKMNDMVGMHLNPEKEQVVENNITQETVVKDLLKAIDTQKYSSANHLFTLDGLDAYERLIDYGRGQLLGAPQLHYYKGVGETTVMRGMQMEFHLRDKSGKKRMFIEDVVLTLNKEGKIQNVAFGLGQEVQKDILEKNVKGWGAETCEVLNEFLESYKTAYSTKNLDYIEKIFANDAIIIVGSVVEVLPQNIQNKEMKVSTNGMKIYKENKFTKKEYLERLRNCFYRNEFVNLNFRNADVQLLDKYEAQGKKIFGVRLKQHYSSSTYSDIGHLYLIIDMTNSSQLIIKIRTWQPNETRPEDLFNSGSFYD